MTNEPKELKRIIYSKLEEVIKYPNHIDVIYEELDALLTQSMRSTEARMTERFRGMVEGFRENQPSNIEHPQYYQFLNEWELREHVLNDILAALIMECGR